MTPLSPDYHERLRAAMREPESSSDQETDIQ